MKNAFRISFLALLLSAFGFAQQEVFPDHFDADAAKQTVKVKQVARKNSKNVALAPAKHHANNKSLVKPALSARVVPGN